MGTSAIRRGAETAYPQHLNILDSHWLWTGFHLSQQSCLAMWYQLGLVSLLLLQLHHP
jgi:hypothetical protein